MLSYLRDSIFGKPQTASTSLLDPMLMKKLDTIILNTTDIQLLAAIRHYKSSLSIIAYMKESISQDKNSSWISEKNYFTLKCEINHSLFTKYFKELQNTHNTIFNDSELTDYKTSINEQTIKALSYLSLLMAEFIKAQRGVENRVVDALPTYNLLLSNIEDRLNHIEYHDLQQAKQIFTDANYSVNETIVNMAKEWERRTTALIQYFPKTQQNDKRM